MSEQLAIDFDARKHARRRDPATGKAAARTAGGMKRDQLPPHSTRRPRMPMPRYTAYENAKRELPKDLTPQQYEAACRALAKRLGV